MAGYRLVARVGDAGLDWSDELVDALNAATGLELKRDHAREERETGPSQGGLNEVILDAVVAEVAHIAIEALRERVRAVLDEFRKRRLDPPEAAVEIEPVDEDDPGEGVEAEA